MRFHTALLFAAGLLVPVSAHAQARKALPVGIVARVNGVPIRQTTVADRLWRESGPVYVYYAVQQAIVRAEAQRRGITVTPEELSERMAEYRAQFTSAAGHQPQDWDIFVKRFTLKRIEDQQRDELLARKIGEAESKAAVLTPEDKDRVLADLERDAHQLRIRQAFIGTGPRYGGRSEADAQARAEEAKGKLASGASWDNVALEYSDDVSTRKIGGDLGFLSRGRMAPELEAAAFEQADNAAPRVVKAAGGFDVFAVVDRRELPPTEADKQKALDQTLARKREIAAQVASWYPGVQKAFSVQRHLPYQAAGASLPKGAVATVNSTPIAAAEVEDRMWREIGQPRTDREINKLITRLEAKKRGISVTAAQVRQEYDRQRKAFVRDTGRPVSDWDALVARCGRANWDDDTAVQMLADRIGAANAKAVTLTQAERAAARLAAVRRLHRVHARQVYIGMGDSWPGRTDADARKLADEALAKLNAGESWMSVVRAYSGDEPTRNTAGDIGFFAREPDDRIPEEVDAVAFAAKPGSPPTIVKARDGYHVIQVLDRLDAKPAAGDYQRALNKAIADKKEIAKAVTSWFPIVMLNYRVESTMPYARG